MLAIDDLTPKLLPAAVSLGLHAAIAACVLAYVAHPAAPPPPGGVTVTIDSLSTAIAPGAEVPSAPAAETASSPGSLPEAAPAPPEQQAKAAPPGDMAAATAVDTAASAEAAPAPPADITSQVASAPKPADDAALPPATSALEASAAEVPTAAAQPLGAPPAAGQPATPAEAAAVDPPSAASAGGPPVMAGAEPALPPAIDNSAPVAASAADRPDQIAVQQLQPPVAVTPATSAGEAESAQDFAPNRVAPLAELVETQPIGDRPSTGLPPAAPASAPPAAATETAVVQAAATQLPASSGAVPVEASASALPTASAETAVPSAPSATLATEPDAPYAPAQVAKLETGPTVEMINDFVTGFEGGPCFFASVAHASANGAAVDVLSNNDAKIHALNDTFLQTFGLDPDVHGQHVTDAQCPAVESLRKSRSGVTLQVGRNTYVSGEALTGTIEVAVHGKTSLYAISYDGRIEDVTRFMRTDGDRTSFAIPVARVDRQGPHSQLLIAVVDPTGQSTARFTLDGGFDAGRFAMAGRMVLISDQPVR